ncbi:extracellular solute-binding protein family 1 [Xylanimonas cellulosilytica DSM 15894]|uniref:Extracellular solute-binding protein family 1 n=1 Tax=Xylanimonas cellulosilytica (strain DSM 15894 / JCM 12276 / CECT 5975 / KCTC 9989 / LMG 20990 / NBRC 107835 / XIL07) TaxID=446471 RepID=D1BY86_XYLCX|nr:extracellular solute-binding protein [Xylanimonas cellulosilytica]ACZ29929.1 extracellular solute-binding protein family 1 [Xylanimonas cellulosilytica DSM 15894]
MKRSLVGTVGMVAAATMVLAACSSGATADDGTGGDTTNDPTSTAADDQQPVTLVLNWWGNDDRADRYEQAVDLFEAEYPWITVQTGFSDFPSYWESKATEAAGRSLPDVFQFDSAYLREYGEFGHILDLQPLVDDGTIDLSGYDESLVSAGNLDGKQVAIPTSTNTLAMFLNPDVIEATGVEFPGEGYTWDDLDAFIQEVADADVSTADGYKIYGSGDYTGTFWFFLQHLVQEGTDPFTQDGQLNFDADDVIAWLDLTADLREAEALYPTARGTAVKPKGGLTMNEAGSEMSWDNFLAGYVADSGKDNIAILPIPAGTDGTSNFFRPSMHLAAGANTEHPHEAGLLINFLLTDPEVGAIFGTSKGVPGDKAQRDAIEAEEGSVDALVIAYEEQVGETETTTAPIPVKGFGTIEASWLTLSEELGNGLITPADFADRWFAEVANAVG